MNASDDKAACERRRRVWRQAASATAVVAGAFCVAVSVVMVVGALRSQASEMRDAEVLNKLKAALQQRSQDAELKERIRRLDLAVRQDFFRRQALLRRGSHLLLGGAGVLAAALASAAALGKEPPHPDPAGLEQNEEERTASLARWAVAAIGLAVAASLAGMTVRWGCDEPLEAPKAPEKGNRASERQPVGDGAGAVAEGEPEDKGAEGEANE